MANVDDSSTEVRDALLAAVAALDRARPADAPQKLWSLEDFHVDQPPYGLSRWTLRTWAKKGRLRCHRGTRGKLLFWDLDLRVAIEADPYVPRSSGANDTDDPLEAALASGELEASSP